MVVCKNLKEFKPNLNSVISIGSFDAIHLGHQSLFKKMNTISNFKFPKSIITFNPHPKTILKPENNFKSVTTLEEKIELLLKYNIDNLLILPFTFSLSKMSAEQFFKDIIIKYFKPKYIVIGQDHCFGYKRQGNFEFLVSKEKEYEYKTFIMEPLMISNNIVNTTSIKNFLINNNIQSANEYLGREYQIKGIIIHGEGRGRKLNFPTANIKINNENKLLPGIGTYCVKAQIKGYSVNGMCNIGIRPTFNDSADEVLIEVNLFKEFKKDLYGEKILINFIKFLRPEKKFTNSDELIYQLKRDKATCKEILQF